MLAVGRGFDGLGLLDDVFEGGVEVGLALNGESSGMGVTVGCGVVAEAEFAEDVFRVAPAEVGFFDVFEVGATADTAFASVA